MTESKLLRCTLRKSADVFAKLVLYASYVVCGVTALVLAVYGAFALYSSASKPTGELAATICGIASAAFSVIFSLLAAIPWYVYVGIAAVAAIPVYSLLWCIAREFTEEDKNTSDDPILLTAIALVCGAIAITYEVQWAATHLGIEYIGESSIHAFAIPVGIAVIPAGVMYILHRAFIGAYLHYRKRMKEERK